MVLNAGLCVKGDDVVNALTADDKAVLVVVGFGGNSWGKGAVADGCYRFVVGVCKTKGSGVFGSVVRVLGGVLVG